MFYTRLATSIATISLLCVILLSERTWLVLSVCLFSIAALWEIFRVSGLIKNIPLCAVSLAAAVVISFGEMFEARYIMPTIYFYVLIIFIIMIVHRKKTNIEQIALSILFTLYIPYFLAHVIFIRRMDYGHVLVWLVFLGACMTDTFAYLVGKTIGRNKLCPSISPKKTVEGAIGGVVGCGLTFMLFGYVLYEFFGIKMHYPNLFLLGLISSVVSELGDLTASIIKRHYGVKDFGSSLPGHGGFLDRLDSILFAAPAIYLFLANFSLIIM